MLSQRKYYSGLKRFTLSLVLIVIGISSLSSLPAYSEEVPAEGGLPGRRLGGGTRASEF